MPPDFRVLLFYRFVRLAEPKAERDRQLRLCREHGLRGRILLSEEGINGTLSGPVAATEAYKAYLRHHSDFHGIEFKEERHDRHVFPRLSIRVRAEIVALEAPTPLDLPRDGGPYVEPAEMREILREEPRDVLIVDGRSKFEYELGHFKGAEALAVDTFRDFKQEVERLRPHREQTIITYCTGGIRCEKLTAMMHTAGFRDVRQLHGGIIRYGQETGGENFQGRCYVFDDRIHVPVNRVNPSVVGRCEHCHAPTELHINCANAACNRQLLLCEACAERYQGACSAACYASPDRRPWDGTGHYPRLPGEPRRRLQSR